MPETTNPRARVFYERHLSVPWGLPTAGRPEREALCAFVRDHQLEDRRVLEVGCGHGAFADLAWHWTGVDLASSAVRRAGPRAAVGSAEALPFTGGAFAALWSVAVLEHVPQPEVALQEMARVLEPGGLLFLAPAWHCRSWASEGLHVRPYRDLSWAQRLRKATIPLREFLPARALAALPRRLLCEATLRRAPTRLRFGRLRPNYEVFWASDSDACSALDPHEIIAWFVSRGWRCLSHSGWVARLLVRHGAVILRKTA